MTDAIQRGIYWILHIESGRCYIGQTAQKGGLTARWATERYELRHGKFNQALTHPLQNAWNKYGEDAFAFEVLEIIGIEGLETDDIKTLFTEREQWWMDNTDSQFNCAPAAGSQLNFKQSPEIMFKMRAIWDSPEYREKMRLNNLNRDPEINARISATLTGRTLPPKHCANIGAAHRGRKQSPEHIAKRVATRKGKPGNPPSPQTRAKLSAANSGKPWSPARRAAHEAKKRIQRSEVNHG